MTYRLATIGTNFITDRLLQNLPKVPSMTLAGVYSRTPERASVYAAAHGAPLLFTSLEDLAASPDIDAVYIGSPTSCHASQAMTLLKAGKHVLCEKPLCSNSRELAAMFQAAKDSSVVLLEAMRPWFTPGFQYIQSMLPNIGPIRQVVLHHCKYSSRYDNYKKGIVENAFVRELSNGALMDVGCYAVGMLAALFGQPEELHSVGRILPGSIDAEGAFVCRYPEMLASVHYSKTCDGMNQSELMGEKANLLFSPIGSCEKIRLLWHDGTREEKEFPTPDFAMNYELQVFSQAITNHDSLPVYQKASEDTMAIMDQVRKQIGYAFPADQN